MVKKKKTKKGKSKPVKLTEKQKAALTNLSPFVQKQFEKVFEHQDQIENLLQNDEERELFKCNPLAFFKRHKIELPNYIEKRLGQFNYDKLRRQNPIILPNGQIISCQSKVNILKKVKPTKDC